MTSITDQPAPTPRPDLIPVWDHVVMDFRLRFEDALDGVDDDNKDVAWQVLNDMRERDELGRARYGTPLTTNNGRDPLVDAYQEMLDGVAYLKAAWLEGQPVRYLYYKQIDGLIVLRRFILAREG